MIPLGVLVTVNDAQARHMTSRHNLITLDTGNLLGGFWGASYASEAQKKEVLHGDDPAAQG